MSTPAATGPQVPAQDKPKRGLSKYVAKFKKALKNEDGSKRLSFSGATKGSTVAAAGPSTTKATSAPEAPPAATTAPGVKTYSRAQLEAERAKKLGERFKLSIEPHEWSITPTKDIEVQRIEKPIRMRVHRTCHKCGTSFGANKTCTSCQHARCTKCPRYPGKKSEKKTKKTEEAAAGTIEVDDYKGVREKLLLTKPSKTGGQPLVRKKPKQRVRRTCHSCSTLFQSGSKECSGCGHVRCEDCPRDPAKKAKYPDGYPGDEPSATSTKPKKFVCDGCNNRFEVPYNVNTDQPPECTSCGHSKTTRVKPKKVEPEPDPEVAKSVQAKLAALNLQSK